MKSTSDVTEFLREYFERTLAIQLIEERAAESVRLMDRMVNRELTDSGFAIPEHAEAPYPRLKRPCVACPFRKDHDAQRDRYVVLGKLHESQAGTSMCHMAGQRICEGARMFREGGHENIIATAEEFIARRSSDSFGGVVHFHQSRIYEESVMARITEPIPGKGFTVAVGDGGPPMEFHRLEPSKFFTIIDDIDIDPPSELLKADEV